MGAIEIDILVLSLSLSLSFKTLIMNLTHFYTRQAGRSIKWISASFSYSEIGINCNNSCQLSVFLILARKVFLFHIFYFHWLFCINFWQIYFVPVCVPPSVVFQTVPSWWWWKTSGASPAPPLAPNDNDHHQSNHYWQLIS